MVLTIMNEGNTEQLAHLIDIGSPATDKEQLAYVLKGNHLKEKHEDSLPEVDDKAPCETKRGAAAISRDTIENVAAGVLCLYSDNLRQVAADISELTRNQEILVETIQQENTRFAEAFATFNLQDLFLRAKHYHSKLIHIKKEMAALYDRSTKLKKRALRLQQLKQKEALQREQQRERELEHEKQLVAKLTTKT